MTMQFSPDIFELAGTRPLHARRRSPIPASPRLGAALVTALVHVVAIIGLVNGLHQVQIFRQPPEVTIHIQAEKKKPQDLTPPAPTLLKPSRITMPVPEVDIATQPPSSMAVALPAAPVTPAPTPGNPATPSKAAATWQGLLLARLEQAKRYPQSARFRHQQGVVLLRFAMDRDGKVLRAAIEKTSGYEALDQEVLALIQRAQPLPKPPADVPGAAIELVVPVEFSLRQ